MKVFKGLLPNSVKQSIKKWLFPELLQAESAPVQAMPAPVPAVLVPIEAISVPLPLLNLVENNSTNFLPLTTAPAYATDSLVSWHNTEFLEEPRFKRAYALGKATNSWHDYSIQWRLHVLCWAALQGTHMEGDFVECGVNLGGFSRTVIDYINFGQQPKTFYLMDTFNGLSNKYILDEEKEIGITDVYGDYYTECYDDVCETFKPFSNVKIIRGTIPDTLSQVTCEKVCYLSIDMNCVLPEIAAAEYFWNKLVSGAIIILDDYGHPLHRLQKHAFDEFAASKGIQVLMLPTGQGLIIKP